eukprot:1160409-Pelagomonas_calceolata.AAC.7
MVDHTVPQVQGAGGEAAAARRQLAGSDGCLDPRAYQDAMYEPDYDQARMELWFGTGQSLGGCVCVLQNAVYVCVCAPKVVLLKSYNLRWIAIRHAK